MQTGMMKGMKTAVSIDDSLMEQADRAARDLGLSRSGFIAEAMRNYLRQRAQARTTEELNRAYGGEPTPDEKRLVRKLKTKLPAQERW